MEFRIVQVLLGLIVSFCIVYFSIPLLRKLAYKNDIYDKPDHDRKLHDRYVPTLGGVALYLAFFFGYSFSGYADQFSGFSYFAAAITLLFFTGLKDDLEDLAAVKKLFLQITAALLVVLGSGISINNFYGVFGIHEIPYFVSVLLSLFTVIVIVNSYNLIDGLDGLAAGIGTIASVFFGAGFWVAGDYAMSVMALITVVTLLGYLRFNFHPAKIFMGDTGSLVIGFLLAVMAIKFVSLNESEAYTAVFGKTSAVLPVAILALPLFDTISVFYKRIRRGVSPFHPDQGHIHHSFIRMGFGQRATALSLYGCSVLITLLALSVRHFNINIVLLVTVSAMFIFLPTNGTKRKMLKMIGFDISGYFASKAVVKNFKNNMEAGNSHELDSETAVGKGIGTE